MRERLVATLGPQGRSKAGRGLNVPQIGAPPPIVTLGLDPRALHFPNFRKSIVPSGQARVLTETDKRDAAVSGAGL